MKEAVRQRARELGFDDCRVTAATAPESAAQFKQWLAEGQHGEMAWLERTAPKRADPQQVLPGARSIIALAASYGAEGRGARGEGREPALTGSGDGQLQMAHGKSPIANSQSPIADGSGPAVTSDVGGQAGIGDSQSAIGYWKSGLVARYARFGDYHDILGERLKQLAEFLNQLGGTGTRSLWYVDTGPLLERDLAQRSGLGFIGKHTNLISRHLGNWFFLAEIITTLDLEPDPPERNRCGSCARCIAACPTAAITAPFRLDARRCISYLTIELRASIPLELRAAIGKRIFGCDDCLAVCPWNRFAREGRIMKAHTRPDLAQPDLLELLALDENGFRRRFAGTPILRARRRGLLRNVCVALGNTGGREALPALQRAARDPESLVLEHARWAIEQIEARHRVAY
jgi:epoxyqueuosine reductase